MRTLLILSMLLAAASALLLAPTTALCATYTVKPDGTGDFATIQEAIVAAADGDLVLLTDGMFTGAGNVDVSFLGKHITVQGQSGNASACIINCEGRPGNEHRGFMFHTGESLATKLADVTIRNGYLGAGRGGGGVSCEGSSPVILGVLFEYCSASSGGAFYAIEGGSPWVGECSFIANTGWNYHGGAVYAHESNPHFADCYFKNNSSQRKGGAIGIRGATSTGITGCTFLENTTPGDDPYFGGGAIHFLECSTPIVSECTFISNSAPRGGAISSQGCVNGAMTSCTFVRNSATWGTSIFLRNSDPWIDRTIIAFDQDGIDALYCAETSDPFITRSCVFGNASGNSLCGSHGGTVYEDPLFCDFWADDLTLHENSPCMPLNNPHGVLVGAHEQGCGYTAVEEKSWGAIKAMYR